MGMNVRKLGTSMVAVGAFAAVAGLAANAIELANDEALLEERGVLDLSSFSVAVFFAGLALVVLGVVLIYVGPRLYESSDHRVVPERRLLQFAIPAAVIALIIGGATGIARSPLSEPTSSTPDTALIASDSAVAAGADGHAHSHDEAGTTDTTAPSHEGTEAAGDAHAHGAVIPGTATGDSPCEQAMPTPASPGQVGAGQGGSQGNAEGAHGDRGMLVQQPLSVEERVTLEAQMRAARTVIDAYPTVAAAEAGGYHQSTPYVPCIGAHYTNIGKVATFDPAAPSELLYDGTNPDSKIVGLSFLVFHADGPPEGFAGPNDHWHQHNANGGLCLKGGLVVGGEDTTEEDCTARGGRKTLLEDIWMVHAWVSPGFECTWGVFSGECPELGGKLGGTAWDA
jgi:hypothetical protein